MEFLPYFYNKIWHLKQKITVQENVSFCETEDIIMFNYVFVHLEHCIFVLMFNLGKDVR